MKKPGFTLIELMIVVAIIAILAAVAVAQYSKYMTRARDSACQSLLVNLALAEMTLRATPIDNMDFLPVGLSDPATIENINTLATLGFRPDQQVGFAAISFSGEPDGNFILFAAHATQGAQVWVYNFVPLEGVRAFDPKASYAALLPPTLTIFSWDGGGDSGGSASAKALGTLTLDPATATVSVVKR